jgi:hypothetical protein
VKPATELANFQAVHLEATARNGLKLSFLMLETFDELCSAQVAMLSAAKPCSWTIDPTAAEEGPSSQPTPLQLYRTNQN